MLISVSHGDTFGHIRLGSPGLVDFGTFSSVRLRSKSLDSGSKHILIHFFSQNAGTLWNAYHLIIFMLMGAVGGLLGAFFNGLNIILYKYRMKYLHKRGRIWRYEIILYFIQWHLTCVTLILCMCIYRMIEAVLIIMVTTASIFIAAIFLGTCVHVQDDTLADSTSCSAINFVRPVATYVYRFTGNYYS